MPRYRLLAVDLDGTLLSTKRRVSEQDLAALAAAKSAGVAIAIVTGRRFPALLPYVEPLAIDPLIVANSGAIVKASRKGPVLRRRLLDLETALAVLELADAHGMEPVVHDGPEGEGHLILREAARDQPTMARYLNQSLPQPLWVARIELARAPVQIGFTGKVETIRLFERRLAGELARRGARVHFARTEYPLEELALLDVLAPDATKSEGLRFLCEHFEISLAETMAVGDNWNDLDMLEAAGLGVVMANAAPELRALGFSVTASNDEAGVARAIERYLLVEGGGEWKAGVGGSKK